MVRMQKGKVKPTDKLYLNAPLGYMMTEKIQSDDERGLRETALAMSDDPEFLRYIATASHQELIDFFLNNSHTFDREFYGVE